MLLLLCYKTNMAKNLKAWLEECKAFDVRPVHVTIGTETWDNACYYKQTFHYQPGMQAVTSGEKTVNDTYTEQGIYVVGRLPKGSGKRSMSGICFPNNDFGSFDWYVAGYILKQNIMETNRSYHPFGEHFILRPWNIPNTRIDDGFPEYRRIPMVLEFV